MLRFYLKVVSFVLSTVFVFGFAAPYLISAKSTELFLLGGTLIIISLPCLLILGKNIIENVVKISNKEKEKETV